MQRNIHPGRRAVRVAGGDVVEGEAQRVAGVPGREPGEAAKPAPGDEDIFSMSRAMMKLFPSHSPGGMLTLSIEECSPRTFDS